MKQLALVAWTALLLVVGVPLVVMAGSSTLDVIDGLTHHQEMAVTTDGSGNFYSNTAIVDGTAAANKLAITSGGAAKVDGSAVTQPVSGTVSTTPPSNASTNVAQFGGSNVVTGTGASGSGVPRVTVSNDSTVQPGNTQNTTPWLVTPTPTVGQGWTPILEAALTSTAVTLKSSAGTLGAYFCYNPNSSVEFVLFYNAASPTVGTTAPTWSIGIPPTSGANLSLANGLAFSSAITVAAYTTASGTGGGAPSSNLNCNFGYK